MSAPDDLDGAAADHALGVGDAAERESARARSAAEADFARRLRGFEDVLAPLSEGFPEIAPPPGLLSAIESRIERADARHPVPSRRRLGLIAASAVAACCLAALGWIWQNWTVATLSVALKSATGETGFVLALDAGRRQVRVEARRAPSVPGRSYELWLIPPGSRPQAVGLVDVGRPVAISIPASTAVPVAIAATWAVTIEPTGGAANGTPSGPPVFAGRSNRS